MLSSDAATGCSFTPFVGVTFFLTLQLELSKVVKRV